MRSSPTISAPEKFSFAFTRCPTGALPGTMWLSTRVLTPQSSATAPTSQILVCTELRCSISASGTPVCAKTSIHVSSITSCTSTSAPCASFCRFPLVLAPVSPDITIDPSGVSRLTSHFASLRVFLVLRSQAICFGQLRGAWRNSRRRASACPSARISQSVPPGTGTWRALSRPLHNQE